jgi:hypothetical protein
MATGHPLQFEQPDWVIDRWWHVRVSPTGDGIAVQFLDITQCKRFEDSLLQARDELERKVREQTEKLKKVFSKIRQSQKALKEANQQLKVFGHRITSPGRRGANALPMSSTTTPPSTFPLSRCKSIIGQFG